MMKMRAGDQWRGKNVDQLEIKRLGITLSLYIASNLHYLSNIFSIINC